MDDGNWTTQIRRGLLELCVLNLLARESMYGYQIVRRLESAPPGTPGAGHPGAGLVISEGTVYPLLSRLKHQGFIASALVESPTGPVRRTYTLTTMGKRHLREINEAWRDIAQSVNQFLIPESPDRKIITVKARNAEAQRLEAEYLAQLRSALAGRESSDAAEILQGVRDHIDEALEELPNAPGDEATAVQMANVLERLGPPESFAHEDDDSRVSESKAAAPPRVSKLAIASALSLPAALILGILVSLLAEVASGRSVMSDAAVILGLIVGSTILLTGTGMGVVALRAVRRSSGNLRGRGLAILGIAELGLAILWCVVNFYIYATISPAQHIEMQQKFMDATRLPILKVTVELPRASPEEVDSEIGFVFRDAVLALSHVKSAKAISSTGHFEGYVEGTVGASGTEMLEELQKQLHARAKDLPAGSTSRWVMLLPAGSTIPVVEVKPVEEIAVRIDLAKTANLGLTVKDVSDFIAEHVPRQTAGATTQASLAEIPIPTPGGRTVRLGDIANLVPTTRPSHIVRTLP